MQGVARRHLAGDELGADPTEAIDASTSALLPSKKCEVALLLSILEQQLQLRLLVITAPRQPTLRRSCLREQKSAFDGTLHLLHLLDVALHG